MGGRAVSCWNWKRHNRRHQPTIKLKSTISVHTVDGFTSRNDYSPYLVHAPCCMWYRDSRTHRHNFQRNHCSAQPYYGGFSPSEMSLFNQDVAYLRRGCYYVTQP